MKHIKIKILIAALAAAAIGACFVGSTFAQFKDVTDPIANEFSVRDVKTEIVEDFKKVSDTSFDKVVQVTNTGEPDCLVRVRVNVTPVSETSNITIDGLSYDAFLASLTAGNEKGWVYNADDGFIYYMDVLKSGDTTKPLMNKVDVLDINAMENFDIIVYEESVQTAVYTEGEPIVYDGSFDGANGINAIFDAYEAQAAQTQEPTT